MLTHSKEQLRLQTSSQHIFVLLLLLLLLLQVLNAACEACQKSIEGAKGKMSVKEAARAVSERDDRLLAEKMEALEAANREVGLSDCGLRCLFGGMCCGREDGGTGGSQQGGE
jgi:hypothetical protein